MQILEDLWYGRICPIENRNERDDAYQELVDLLERNKKKLLPTLNQTQQEDLQKMQDLWEEMNRASECSAFITGFRLAVQLITASV